LTRRRRRAGRTADRRAIKEFNETILAHTHADAQLAYFIRRPLWRCPTETLAFSPESLGSLQRSLPADWPLRYCIYDTRGDRSAFRRLAGTCPGQLVAFPGSRVGQSLIVFDIGGLVDPTRRTKLTPETREAQLKGKFSRWDQPDFAQRLAEVLRTHGKI